MSIGLYIVLAPLYLKSVRKLQEKRFVFVKILAIIIPENGAKVSKIKCFQFAQQTLYNEIRLDNGFLTTDENMQTEIPGVYAVGDIRVKQVRQVSTAVADGTIAAIHAAR